ncbi:pitrilysin family protein [Cognatishimia sp. SS12]|uniref:M16 family metallopeptidase n=1 Tax=Cognatishimia sp. SS12 TaxID=2979465 RepID=UPI00232DD5DA|nr:pitrilysin family protein [Cognatishimia sp. SS12]MDC0737970.1 pitrilysin family protein [Cognatishimia sp. SS12]
MIRFVTVFAALMVALPLRAEIAIKEVVSPGGITAWLVEEHSIPFVALELRFKGGGSLDAPGKRGATNLMVGLLEEGTGEMDAMDYARAAEELAAEFEYDTFDDSVMISARFLSEYRDASVDLLRRSIVAPRFDDVSIARVKDQVIAAIRADAKDPDRIAGRTFDALAFGDHPYATSLNGTEASVTALSRDDILAAHTGALALDRVYVSAVGDITAEELGLLLDRLLSGLPETGAALPAAAEYALEGGETLVNFATPQSVAIFGHEGIERHDPDFFAAYVLNVILGGGGFESRLMTEVREKRGLTYGVNTFLIPKDHGQLYLGSVASANDRIRQAMTVIRDEWARMAAEGPSEEELAEAKTYLTGAYPLRFDGNGPIANILVGMQLDDLPIDYAATRNDKVNAVTLEDVRRVAQRILRPEDLHFVIVGQPEG